MLKELEVKILGNWKTKAIKNNQVYRIELTGLRAKVSEDIYTFELPKLKGNKYGYGREETMLLIPTDMSFLRKDHFFVNRINIYGYLELEFDYKENSLITKVSRVKSVLGKEIILPVILEPIVNIVKVETDDLDFDDLDALYPEDSGVMTKVLNAYRSKRLVVNTRV